MPAPVPTPAVVPWLTTTEAADYLGLTSKTIRRYIASGKLPARRIGVRVVRVRRDDLDGLLSPVDPAA